MYKKCVSFQTIDINLINEQYDDNIVCIYNEIHPIYVPTVEIKHCEIKIINYY